MTDVHHITFMLILTVLFEAYALYSIQHFQKTKTYKYLIICCIIYGLFIPYFIYQLLESQGIGIVNFLWNMFSTISGFLIGVYLFKEKVQNIQWIGVLLGILAFFLIIFGRK